MLSDAERTRLGEIELDLRRHNPALFSALTRHELPSGTCLAYDAVTALSGLGGLVCLALSNSGGAQGGATALVFAMVTLAIRTWRFGPR